MTGPMAPVPGGPAGPPPIQPAPPGAPSGPVTLPAAGSRATSNLLGSLGGIVLVGVGLELALRFARQTRTLDGIQESINVGPLIWTIIGAILIAAPALLARWASWTPIVPGFILAGLSVWTMVTPFRTGGGQTIADATDWAFDNGEFAIFCNGGMGLTVGLTLLLAGIAAALLRAGVRREIRTQLGRQ